MGNRSLVVNRDKNIYLIEKLDSNYEVEDQLSAYATLVHAPNNVHTYSLDEYSLWSASLQGYKEEEILSFLKDNSKNKLPQLVIEYIKETFKEFWEMEILVNKDTFELKGNINELNRVLDINDIKPKIKERKEDSLFFEKKNLYDVRDSLLKENLYLRENSKPQRLCNLELKADIQLYEYQEEAVRRFINSKEGNISGRGVITMPPGSGKTIVALKIIELLGVSTLVLVEDKTALDTWLDELEEKTNLDISNVSRDTLECNSPISICTYGYALGNLKNDFNSTWGLIIYDNANFLPAENYCKTAYITSKYKLAMDAIIWRSDNNEGHIFKAIGPKIFNLTLKKLERENYQIKVNCYEVKIPFKPWDIEEEGDPNHTASKNLNKIDAYKAICKVHKNANSVLVSRFIKVSKKFNEILDITLYDKDTKDEVRKKIVNSFNTGETDSIVFTDVFGNQPLKDIDIFVSLSYHGKSKREEYLRIGKLKGSNKNTNKIGYYYALVSQGTKEEEVYAVRRNEMLKHGYNFKIITLDELGEYSNET